MVLNHNVFFAATGTTAVAAENAFLLLTAMWHYNHSAV